MKKILMAVITGLALWNVEVTAQPSVFEYNVDTTLYDNSIPSSYFVSGPELPE